MKLTIPEEYRSRFKSERAWIRAKGDDGKPHCIVQDHTFVFMTRWMKHSLLLMNGEERKRLVSGLDAKTAEASKDKAFLRFMKAGIAPVMLVDGAVEIPERLTGWLGDGEINFEEIEGGVRVFKSRKK